MRMANAQPDLTIVIPAYREAKRIGATLTELARFLHDDPVLGSKHIELIVVAADTDDDTHGVVLAHRHLFQDFRLLRPGPKLGKGRDVRYGMLRARGKAVIFMDADLATPLKYLPEFYLRHLAGHDLVVATRNLRRHHPNFVRRLVSNCGNLIFRFASGIWIEDSQCGFKLFSHHAAQTCFSRLSILGWGFDMEILAIAKAQKFKTSAYRIDDWTSKPGSTFTESFVSNSIKSLRELGSIFWRRLRGAYR